MAKVTPSWPNSTRVRQSDPNIKILAKVAPKFPNLARWLGHTIWQSKSTIFCPRICEDIPDCQAQILALKQYTYCLEQWKNRNHNRSYNSYNKVCISGEKFCNMPLLLNTLFFIRTAIPAKCQPQSDFQNIILFVNFVFP